MKRTLLCAALYALCSIGLGCDVVLGIDEPKRLETQGGPSPAEGVCRSGDVRCESGGSQERSTCRAGAWAPLPCEDGAQCNADDPTNCTVKGEPGVHCAAGGTFACATTASAARSFCNPDTMIFEEADACAEGEGCARGDGSCHPLDAACAGHKPGDAVCDGTQRHVCNQDLLEHEGGESCKSAEHCKQATGEACATCIEGEHSCKGAVLSVCNAARDGWTVVETCANAALCNALVGQCTSSTCRAGQSTCDGDQLKTCNADGTGFGPAMTCDSGRCDAPAGECDVCSADSCADGARLVCSADGQQQTREECPEERPLCVGQGSCVQCQSASDCVAAGECNSVACASNVCEVSPRREGTSCYRGGGACDGHGECVPLEPPTIASIVPQRSFQGLNLDAVIHGAHLANASAAGFERALGLDMSIDRGGDDDALPVVIEIGSSVTPGMYQFEVTTPGGVGSSGSVTFEVVFQPLASILPASAAVGSMLTISAKPGSPIHDPILVAGAAATGTTVVVSEDGFEIGLMPIVSAAGVDGGQTVTVTVPPRQGAWSAQEIVSILVDYTGPGGPTSGVLEFTYAP